MDLDFNLLSEHKYTIDDLSLGADIISVVGCFAPSPNSEAITQAQKVLDDHFYLLARRSDDNPEIFDFFGVEFPVPDGGAPGFTTIVFVQTPMEPDPVEVVCVLGENVTNQNSEINEPDAKDEVPHDVPVAEPDIAIGDKEPEEPPTQAHLQYQD